LTTSLRSETFQNHSTPRSVSFVISNPIKRGVIMDREWDVLLQTIGGTSFTLGVFAFNENIARNKAKKLGQGCKILGIKEANLAGVSTLSHLKV